ncbi:MAG: hypothetical protein L0Y66_20280 [Myxococcaceae bacterium]|nr:hypothetical protein [Myxococcaceae bacterium]
MNQESHSPQEQHEKLQAELASRQSTVHFAHAGVSLVWAMLIAGAAIKLFVDSARVPYLAWAATLATVGLTTYALVRFRRAREALRDELVRFEQLKALRRQLKVDDPSALLPG